VSETPSPRRLGRPPAVESRVTRERIVDSARHTFAELGYSATTNQALAVGAGVTTGAIYHYFDSKPDLYRVVYEEVQAFVYARFDAIVSSASTFADGLAAILEAAHEMNNEDPTLARFLGAVRIDLRRTRELHDVIERPTSRRNRFIADLVQVGVRSGELAPTDAARATAVVLTLLIGLVDAGSDSPADHRATVDAIRLLVDARLVHARQPAAVTEHAAPPSGPTNQ
jgi:AcrR family transcriptional regulator